MKFKFFFLAFSVLFMGASFASCSEDDDEPVNKEYDGTLYGEWVEDSDNQYIFGYYCFYSDGTGISGSYEADIDWVNEEDDFTWYTENRKYLHINGGKYEYSCNGSTLEIKMNGKTKRFYEK